MGLVANERKKETVFDCCGAGHRILFGVPISTVSLHHRVTDTAVAAAASSVWFGVSKIASIKHIVIKVVMEILSMA